MQGREFLKKIIRFSQNDYLILGLIFLIVGLSNLIWLKIDTRPPHWDASNHLMHSLARLEWLIPPSWDNFRRFYGGYTYYPPFVYWVTSFFYWLFGKGEDVAVYSNLLFLGILIFSTYGIAKYFWGRKTGTLSALVVSIMPVLLSQSREYQLDFPLTAMVTLSLYLLLKTQTFKNRLYSILFGISFAFGFLTKWTFPVFLIIPVLYFLIRLIFENIKTKKLNDAQWLNVCFSFLIILFLAGPWYIWNLPKLKASFAENIQCGINEGDPQTFLPSLFWYLKFWIINHMRLLLLLPFIVGFALSFLKKEIFKKNLFLLLFLLIGFLIMIFYSNKDIRFIEPLMPAVAIFISYWIFLLPKKIGLFGSGYLILTAIFYFWTVSFGIKSLPVSWGFEYKNFSFPLYIQHGYTMGGPVRENWYQKEILRDIARARVQDRVVRLNMFYQDKMFFNKENFKYYILLNKYPIDLRYPFSETPEAEKGDFLLVNSKTKEEAEVLVKNFDKELINQYSLPDATLAFLYKIK
jgi:4-amino-4-deoxy-L-arabinose transferase-like glycosyltransferase